MSTTTIKHKHNKTSLQQGIPSQDLQHVIACYDLGCCVQFAALLSSGQLIQLCYDLGMLLCSVYCAAVLWSADSVML